jgi:Tfp pilus assembly protein PilF
MGFARNLAIVLLLWTGALLAGDRGTADAFLAGVPALLASSDYKTAEDICKRALQADDTCPAAHFYLGTCYEKMNKPREAYKEYQAAATFASKEKDTVLASKSSSAAKKLGAGLVELDVVDQKLAAKIQSIATDALDAGQLETAKQAFNAWTVLQPNNAKAKEGLEKVNKAIDDRGDPVKAKVAQAMLSEMWYKLGTGKKDEASDLAKRLSKKYGETEWGKEADELLARDFATPKDDDVLVLAKKLKEQNAKKAKPASKTETPASSSSSPKTSTPSASVASAPSGGLDVEALEKAADEATKKLSKDALVSTFVESHQKGKTFYSKATPGSEGNQENVSKALDQFIKCASLYVRIENEKLNTEELAAKEKDASMLRYACMKMTILAH